MKERIQSFYELPLEILELIDWSLKLDDEDKLAAKMAFQFKKENEKV